LEIGRHSIEVNSIDKVDFEKLLKGNKANVLYTDPPWNNMKFWKTLAEKQTGKEVRQIEFETAFNSLIEIIKNHVKGWVFIESGISSKNKMISWLKKEGFEPQIFETKYKSGGKFRPALIFVFSTIGRHYKENLTGLTGQTLVNEAIHSTIKPNGTVIDPFCGKGMTAKTAVKFNLTFIGCELNAVRAEETKKILWRNFE